MTTIHAATYDQVLSATVLPKVSCNNKNTVRFHVSFDSAWNRYAKSAVFYTSWNPTVYEKVFSSDDICIVPPEVLTEAGYLFIGVKGVSGSEVKMSTVLKYKVEVGTPSVVISAPTPNVYQQLLNENAILKSQLNSLMTGSTTEGSEVIGIRTDADGKTHDSAADAVISQVLSVRDGTNKTNLIDVKKLTAGWLQNTGELSLSHQMGNYYRWEYTTDYIPVTPALPYMLSIAYDRTVAGWCCVCTYDSEKNFISRMFVNEHSDLEYHKAFTFADDVVYVRISYRSHGTAEIKFEQSTYATKFNEDIMRDNLIETFPLQFEGYIVDNGSIYPQTAEGYAGEGVPALKEMYSRHIPVTVGDKYTVYHAADEWGWYAIGIYDTNGMGITRLKSSDTKLEFTIPEGAHTIMLCARTHYLKDFALFKNNKCMCDGQKVRENYFDLLKANEKISEFDVGYVNSIAHRGFSVDAPENTLAAFRLAKEKGFQCVECDVSFTSDGVAVLLHDSTIDRTSNGAGSISALTFTEVRELDFGSWKSAKYAGEKIPSFEEFISLCKSLGLHPYIELKEGTEEQIKSLVGIVKRYSMKNKVTWISFNSVYLTHIKAVDPKARLGFVVSSVDASTIKTVAQNLQSGYNEVFVDCNYGNAAVAAQLCAEADIPLEVWTVNGVGEILALDVYVSGVTSDNLIAGSLFYDNRIGG